jgi:hypothetical protein
LGHFDPAFGGKTLKNAIFSELLVGTTVAIRGRAAEQNPRRDI